MREYIFEKDAYYFKGDVEKEITKYQDTIRKRNAYVKRFKTKIAKIEEFCRVNQNPNPELNKQMVKLQNFLYDLGLNV